MTKKRNFLESLRGLFTVSSETVELKSEDRLRLSGKGLRVPARGLTFVVEMGKQTIHLCPDRPLDPHRRNPPYDYLLLDPNRYYAEISQAVRLKPGETLKIDHRHEYQRLVFQKPKHAFRRHLQIRHEGESLVFSDPISELGTYLSQLSEDASESAFETKRASRLARIHEIFGGPLQPLPPDEALETIRAVNQALKTDAYRRLDSFGNAGSLVELPPYLKPVIVGDLHAQVDNLLTLLINNSFLEALEQDEAALILLGDAVHLEAEAKLKAMESSMLIMDLILKLKLRFPKNVFFIIGNHDSFSPDVMKGGIPQSVLWEKEVLDKRGADYRQEMALFYRQSPLVVLSKDFVACHAGPPRSKVTLEKLVEARQFPELVHELTWNRIKSKNWLLGYTKADVRRFRKSLDLDDGLPFIVAHYPQDREETLWLDVNQIANHHILYSARPDRIAIFTRVRGELIPQIYPTEQLENYLTD